MSRAVVDAIEIGAARRKFAELLLVVEEPHVAAAMMYLAGVLENRRAIHLDTGIILLSMKDSSLPKMLHEVWGGSLYWRVQGKTRSRVFKVQGALAREMMRAILPYLVFTEAQVRRFLKCSED